MIDLVAIDIAIKMEMSDKEEEVFTRVTQVNLHQLRILARS